VLGSSPDQRLSSAATVEVDAGQSSADLPWLGADGGIEIDEASDHPIIADHVIRATE
jgi:hypothetical protein